MVARRRRGDPVQPGRRQHTTLLLPGNEDPPTVADRRVRENVPPNGACGEPDAGPTRTSGSEGGPGKRAGGNTGTASRSDPTRSRCTAPTTRSTKTIRPRPTATPRTGAAI